MESSGRDVGVGGGPTEEADDESGGSGEEFLPLLPVVVVYSRPKQGFPYNFRSCTKFMSERSPFLSGLTNSQAPRVWKK